MDVNLLHHLPEDKVKEESGDYNYLSSGADSPSNGEPVYPFLLFLIAALCCGTGTIATLVTWGVSAVYPGQPFADKAMLEINVLRNFSILPVGTLAPIMMVAGFGLVKKLRWGLCLFAFLLALNISSSVWLIIKLPGLYLVVSSYGMALWIFQRLHIALLFIYSMLFLYLMTSTVRNTFHVTKKEAVKIYLIAIVLALLLGGLITYYSSCIFGWELLSLGYENTQWFR